MKALYEKVRSKTNMHRTFLYWGYMMWGYSARHFLLKTDLDPGFHKS